MGDYELYHADRKKHKYIKKIGNRYFYTQQEIAAYLKEKKEKFPLEYSKDTWKNYTTGETVTAHTIRKKKPNKYGIMEGISVAKGKNTIEIDNGFNKKAEKKNNGDVIRERRGRLSSTYYEDGSIHTIDLSKKKKVKQRAAEEEKQAREYGDTYINHDKERKKKVKAAKSHVTNQTKKTVKSMKKQSAKGKKALKKFYKNNVNPGVTVTYDEAKIH